MDREEERRLTGEYEEACRPEKPEKPEKHEKTRKRQKAQRGPGFSNGGLFGNN